MRGHQPLDAALGLTKSLVDRAAVDGGDAREQIGVRPPERQVVLQRQAAQPRGMESAIVDVLGECAKQATGERRRKAKRLEMAARLGVFQRDLAPDRAELTIAK